MLENSRNGLNYNGSEGVASLPPNSYYQLGPCGEPLATRIYEYMGDERLYYRSLFLAVFAFITCGGRFDDSIRYISYMPAKIWEVWEW